MKGQRSALLIHAVPVIAQTARSLALAGGVDRALGALVLVAQVLSLAIAARRYARGLALGDGVETFLGGVTIFLVVPAAVISWLGAVGLAGPLPVVVVCAVIAAALDLLAKEPAEGPPPAAPFAPIERAILAFAVACAAAMTLNRLREATRDADSVWYHLTTAAEIVRTGSIRPNPILTENALGYPGLREALVAWLSLPLRSVHPALLFPIEIAAAAAALYALGRGFGIARPALLAAVAVLAASPVVATAAIEHKNDLFLAAALLLTWRFLREAARTGATKHAALAGLAAGLAAGAKFAGVLAVALSLALWAVVDLRLARARRLVIVTLAAIAVAGAWYGRNLVLFHNPFFPKHVAVLGHTVLPGLPRLEQQLAITVLGLDPRRIVKFAGQFVAGLGPIAALAFIAPIAAPIAARRGHPRFIGGAWVWLGLLPALLFVLYAMLPYSVHPKGTTYWYVQPRFLIAFLAVTSLGLAALVPDRGRARDVGVAILALLAIGGAFFWLPGASFGIAVALSVAATRLPIEIAASLARVKITRLTVAAALVPLAFAALALDAHGERVLEDPVHGYRADPVEGWGDVSLWVRKNISGKRVVYTGTIQMFPLYGPGLTNTLFWAKTDPRRDDADDLFRAARAHDADYIVAFSPVKLRFGAKGERFEYATPPTRVIAARHPGAVEQVFASGHAEVVRVIKPIAVDP